MHLKSLCTYIVLILIFASQMRTSAQSIDSALIKIEKVLSSFESGIAHGTIEEFYAHFGGEIYLSFHSGIRGSFSSNQSFFLIKDFLNDYTPIKFNYTKKKTDSEYPYGIGTLYYNRNGVKGILQVFISLNMDSGNCKISQITID